YLFAKVWRNIFFELSYLDLGDPTPGVADDFSLQTWIFNKTALCINQDEAPALETVQYAIDIAPPPFWCYLQTALDQLPPLHRLVLALSQTFHWSDVRIAGFLEAEGDRIERGSLPQLRTEAYAQLCEHLPEDIQIIYQEKVGSQTS
ncbi:MAG TPA: sigma-70 family RNA polymerase sigma factor, partial [Stenomitos sp.]